ncbi:MAG: hypothetical protein CM1200mP30_07700 [Pseudomonadota bacterium]|nr:MAG: hypothetical protein CM1200mP30_07700 [Pseudomonadota bacterium]
MLSEHQAGRYLGMQPSGIRVRGRRSTPGRYFQVANPGHGWGGTDVSDPLEIIDRIKEGPHLRDCDADGQYNRRRCSILCVGREFETM